MITVKNLASNIKPLLISLALLAFLTVLVCINSQSPAQGQNETMPSSEEEVPYLSPIPLTGYKPVPKSATSEEGRKWFEDLNCVACHSIHNVGGAIGPMLDGVCGRRSDQFLIAHLSRSQEALEEYKRIRGIAYFQALQHPRFTPERTRLLVAYLKTLPEPPGGYVVMPHRHRLPTQPSPATIKDFRPAAKTGSSAAGERAYNTYGCAACHSIGEIGGWLGPRLDGIGARRDRAYIKAHITDAQAHARALSEVGDEFKSEMPRFNLPEDEAIEITNFLMTLPNL